MVSFGKNKDDAAAKKHRHRYDLSAVNEEIADVLLTEKNDTPLAIKPAVFQGDQAADGFAPEDEDSSASKSSVTATLNAQVEKLCREYAAINQQLEKSLTASNDLTTQLEKSKKVVAASYLAIGIASLAFVIGIAAIVVGMNMQRDVADLKESVISLTNQTVAVKNQTALTAKEINNRITQLNDKADKIYAMDNLENLLQVTEELRKQVQSLASKDFTQLNANNPLLNEPAKAEKIVLPSLKLNPDDN